MADVPVNDTPPVTVVAVSANGQVAFDYDFRADKVDDLRAEYRPASGAVTPLIGGVDFVATGLHTATGGTITLVTFTATVAGATIAISRDIAIERLTDYTRDLFADDLNQELDTVFMILQELATDIGRSIQVPVGEAGYTIVPPIDEGRALIAGPDNTLIAGPNAADIANAEMYAAQAQGAYLAFDARYLGAKSVPPTTDNQGHALVEGALYWDIGLNLLNVWNGAAWEPINGVADGSITVPKLHAQVINRLIEFDIRDSRFAGGAPWNGIDDDTPAFTAALAYFQTLNIAGRSQYQGNKAAVLHLPRGMGKANNIDMTAGGTNVQIIGESEASTTIMMNGVNPLFKSTNVTGVNDLYRTGFRDFTIYGPGRANANAHGFDMGAINNGYYENIRIYGCRDGLRVVNNWQTIVADIKMDGGALGGSLTCYNGIHMLDGPGSVVENAIKVTGGVIAGCENWAFRGESVSGSVIEGLEMLGAGNCAMYLGDNPSGKDLKWFTVTGCLFDTSGDLLRIHRGGAAFGGQMNFEGNWFGYANQGAGLGVAIEMQGIEATTMHASNVLNSDVALIMDACGGNDIAIGAIQGYDRSLVGSIPIQINNSIGNKFAFGPFVKTVGSATQQVIAETGGSNGNGYDVPIADGFGVFGSTSVVRGGRTGLISKIGGLATIPTTASSAVVAHGLTRTPVDGEVQISSKFNLGSVGVADIWVDNFTSTTFTVHTNANPSSTLGIAWMADASRG